MDRAAPAVAYVRTNRTDESSDLETQALSLLALALDALIRGGFDEATALMSRIPSPEGRLQRAMLLPAATAWALAPAQRTAWEAVPAQAVQTAVLLARVAASLEPIESIADIEIGVVRAMLPWPLGLALVERLREADGAGRADELAAAIGPVPSVVRLAVSNAEFADSLSRQQSDRTKGRKATG